MNIAILSDTHGLLRPEVVECLKTADAILHGWGHQPAGNRGPAAAVRTAVRRPRQQRQGVGGGPSPTTLTVTLGGVTFYMVHNKKEVPADLSGVDAVVFGHSHKYVQEEKDRPPLAATPAPAVPGGSIRRSP